MEISDDIKRDWAALSDMLARQQRTNEALLRETLRTRAGRSYSRIVSYTWGSLIVGVLIIPLTILAADYKGLPDGVLYALIAGLVVALCIQGAALWSLSRADIGSSNIASYERATHNFMRFITASYLFCLPYFSAIVGYLVVSYFALLPAGRIWIIVAAMLLFIMLCWVEYRFLYRDRIRALQKSAAELREFMEE